MLNIKTHLKQKHEVKEEIKLTIKCVKSRNCPNIYRSFKAMTNHVRRCRMNQNNEYEEDLLCFDDVGHDAAGNLTERIDLQEPDDEMVAGINISQNILRNRMSDLYFYGHSDFRSMVYLNDLRNSVE